MAGKARGKANANMQRVFLGGQKKCAGLIACNSHGIQEV
jgi:hypothetical protein